MAGGFTYTSSEWRGPGARPWTRVNFRLWPFLKAMIFPAKGERLLPTPTGYVLIIVTLGLLMAAYNTTSNVLFITASLLLSCIAVSLALAWFNIHGICWRMVPDPTIRAGEETRLLLELRNNKRWLPTYAISFVVEAGKNGFREILHLDRRLEPGETIGMECVFVPELRGPDAWRLASVSSQFPFGFLKKHLNGGEPVPFTVWPRKIAYRFHAHGAGFNPRSGRSLARVGQGWEFHNLRDYRYGDSHRQIHWKATARQGALVVQQYAAETQAGYVLAMDAPASLWREGEQFERLCSLVSSLAENLFADGRLLGARIGRETFRFSRRPDLDFFQDRLAVATPLEDSELSNRGAVRNVITFEPSPTGAVNAYVGGKRVSTA